ncbi:hypothetical protein KRM28CT15_50620 [Krasilnikovia sp. M28-CT-15]
MGYLDPIHSLGLNDSAYVRRNGMSLVIAVVAALVAGFMAGLFIFKIKRRWCPMCGATLECPTHGAGIPLCQTNG